MPKKKRIPKQKAFGMSKGNAVSTAKKIHKVTKTKRVFVFKTKGNKYAIGVG